MGSKQCCSDWSFDLVQFKTGKRKNEFIDVLRENNLVHNFRLCLDRGTQLERTKCDTKLFFWTDRYARVMLLSKDNPITGEASVRGEDKKRWTGEGKSGRPVRDRKYIGLADKIGISGNFDRVEKLVNSIKMHAVDSNLIRETACKRFDVP